MCIIWNYNRNVFFKYFNFNHLNFKFNFNFFGIVWRIEKSDY